jgi:glycosyltransferase involved in cell wall biosynthesis
VDWVNNVLVVSYYFPPFADVSVVRVKKHCKYLTGYDWKPWVITVDPRYYKDKVVDDLKDVRDTKIIRVPYLKLPGSTFLVKLFFPIFVAVYTLINKSLFDAVYMTGSPFHPFILTSLFTGIFNIPTVLDFRDSWSFNHGFDGRSPESLKDQIREYFSALIEKISIKFASKIIFSTHILQYEYSNQYSEYKNKFTTITNGYDPDDFLSIRPNKIVEDRSLILTGKFILYTPELVPGLFEALKEINQLKFIYVGSEHREIIELARKHEVDDRVVSIAYKPYKESLDLISGADYAMTTTGLVYGTGTKIFDYLALGKPTICFVPKGSIIKLEFDDIEQVVIEESPHSQTSILKGLEKLLSIRSIPSSNRIEAYSRVNASQSLARILNEVASEES